MVGREFISVLGCLTLLAQAPRTPTFQTTTNLVVVNVTVRDKSGKLIDSLNKDDFILTEDDKSQAISVFEVQHLSSDPLPAAMPADNRAASIRPPAAQPAVGATPEASRSRRDKR